MENNSTTLFGFEAITDVFSDSTGKTNFNTDIELSEEISDEELENLQKQSPKRGVGTKKKEVEEDEDDTEDEDNLENDEDQEDTEDEENLEETVKETKKAKTTKTQKTVKPLEEEEEEEESEDATEVTALFDAIAEEIGWEFDDEEVKEKPTSVEGLVSYFKDVIKENSVPNYANEEIQELDEFVRNGGKLEDYLTINDGIDYDNFDTTEENNQKRIVKMMLSEKGFSEKQIIRKIEKYEDAGILEDEAEDAVEAMKEIVETKKEQLLENQKKHNEQMVINQQKFVDSVVGEIKGLDNVRGIKVPEKDRKELLTYIFKTDANGVTQYQKDFRKSVKNLIESAYFTMKGDTLLSAAKKMGTSSAMKNLKQSLKSSGAGKGTKRINTNSSDSTFSRLVQLF